MKKYLGVIYLFSKPVKIFGIKISNETVHRFSDCIIEADNYISAHEKMKEYADKYVAKAKKLPNSGFMKNLTHESFVTESI